MGNHKFKLSDMMPNAWFYKLKEIGNKASTTTTTNTKPIMKNPKPYVKTLTSPPSTPQKSHKHIQDFTPNRASYYISTRLDIETNKLSIMDPPRKSKSRRRSKKRPIKPINCTTSRTDIIIDVASERLVSKTLPPIITKQPNLDEVLKTQEKKCSPKETYIQPNFDEVVKTQEKKSPPKETYKQPKFDEVIKSKEKKSPPKESYKLKTRVKSPRVLSKHRKSNARKSDARKSETENGVLDGFAVVKSSSDPHKDFRESMVEMIMENKICKSKDLEDLLACYLSLNSTEYHDVIVKVFEQIWFDFREIRV